MAALLVTSLEKGGGKTVVCAGLGKYLQSSGKKVGYLKPAAGGGDSDAEYMKNALSLGETAEAISPAPGKTREAYSKVAQGKDIVIIEGTSDVKADAELAKELGARVIVIENYSAGTAGKAGKYAGFGDSLLGAVLNRVPVRRAEMARSEAEVNVIGILPEDRTLFSPTMGELVGRINGEVVRGAGQSSELVENVMLGALTVDHGPDYFGLKDNKMVVLKSDRPDMQMAAMETSTRCMVISDDTPLKQVVLERAEEKDIPIVLVKDDCAAVVDTIEDALAGGKLVQEKKLPRIAELVSHNIDVQAIGKELGLAK